LKFTIILFKETFMGLPCPMTSTNKSLVHGKRIKEKSDGTNKRRGMAPKLSPSFYPTKMHTFHYKKQKGIRLIKKSKQNNMYIEKQLVLHMWRDFSKTQLFLRKVCSCLVDLPIMDQKPVLVVPNVLKAKNRMI